MTDSEDARTRLRRHVSDLRETRPLRLSDALAEGSPPAPRVAPAVPEEPVYAWQVWTMPTAAQQPTITVRADGTIVVNAVGDLLIGRPEHVRLAYCQRPPLIGLQPVTRGTSGAIRVKRAGDTPGFTLRAAVFLDHHGIAHSATQRWTAEKLDGHLAARLDRPGQTVKPRGGRKREDVAG